MEDDDQVYRRQPLLVKSTRLLEEIRLEDLTPASLTAEERADFTRLAWIDKQNLFHDVAYPLTAEVIEDLKETMARKAPQKAEDTNGDEEPDSFYHVVRKYKDNFLPVHHPGAGPAVLPQGPRRTSRWCSAGTSASPPPRFSTRPRGAWEPYRWWSSRRCWTRTAT